MLSEVAKHSEFDSFAPDRLNLWKWNKSTDKITPRIILKTIGDVFVDSHAITPSSSDELSLHFIRPLDLAQPLHVSNSQVTPQKLAHNGKIDTGTKVRSFSFFPTFLSKFPGKVIQVSPFSIAEHSSRIEDIPLHLESGAGTRFAMKE